MAVCIIPAKGTSRRIPGKNMRVFHGRPILGHSIVTARASGLFDRIIVSTDDDRIARFSAAMGVNVHRRSSEMCDDAVGTQAVARRVLIDEGYRWGLACVVYATAPLMLVEDLQRGHDCMTKVPDLKARFAMSVGPGQVDAGQWYWGKIPAFLDCEPLDVDDFHTWKVRIPDERVCDINTLADWRRAEKLYEEMMHGHDRTMAG